MAETDNQALDGQQADPQGTNPQGSDPNGQQEVDWKAKFEEAKAHSRKWEDLAKKNKDKAAKLDEIEEAQKSEAQKAADALARAEKAEQDAKAYQAQIERMGIVQRVASDTKVPAELLQGDTEEELRASAKALLEFAGSIPPEVPADQGGANTPPPISEKSLEGVKNPIERIRIREQMNLAR